MKWESPTRYSDYLQSIPSAGRIHPQWRLIKQLGHCQAWVVMDTANYRICLQSYSTIVSYKDRVTTKIVRLGKWTRTTSCHQTRFEHEYG